MRERCAVAALAAGKSGEECCDAAAEIYGQAKNCAQLDDDGIHLPVAIVESQIGGQARDVQQRFREPQVRGRRPVSQSP